MRRGNGNERATHGGERDSEGRDARARAPVEGKHSGEVANIWGSGGRATRGLIELYRVERTLHPPTVVARALFSPPLTSAAPCSSSLSLFLLHRRLFLASFYFPGLLTPGALRERPPFRSLSLALFIGKVLDRVLPRSSRRRPNTSTFVKRNIRRSDYRRTRANDRRRSPSLSSLPRIEGRRRKREGEIGVLAE